MEAIALSLAEASAAAASFPLFALQIDAMERIVYRPYSTVTIFPEHTRRLSGLVVALECSKCFCVSSNPAVVILESICKNKQNG